jgi:adenosyl cobinamide kinase/adenosyl cobinamide phosphate guanylyltransferase
VALTVLLGGARSGKSRLALELAAASGAPVTFLATGEARDDEMADRIERHRAERPAEWATVEEPYAIEDALARIDPGDTVVLDCLTLWTANALERDGAPEPVLEAAERAARVAAAREGTTIAISNEVGLGIVPATELGRAYRDLLGSVNRLWADAAAEAHFVIAGRSLPLERIAP